MNAFRVAIAPTLLLFVVVLGVLVAACGQDSVVSPTPDQQVRETETFASPSPTAVLAEGVPSPEASPVSPEPDTAAKKEPPEQPTATPTAVLTDRETGDVAETPTPTPVPPTATPTAAPTPEPTPLGIHTVIDDYAFSLRVDGEVEVKASGWLQSNANDGQGQVAFAFGGATVLLIWLPAESSAPAELVAAGFEILGSAQTALTLEAVGEGLIEVSGNEGSFGGFVAIDQSGSTLGGGLIGGWLCGGTGFVLSVSGSDSTIVQVRFDRVLAGFECAGG